MGGGAEKTAVSHGPKAKNPYQCRRNNEGAAAERQVVEKGNGFKPRLNIFETPQEAPLDKIGPDSHAPQGGKGDPHRKRKSGEENKITDDGGHHLFLFQLERADKVKEEDNQLDPR